MANRTRIPLNGRDGSLGWLDPSEQPANREEALVRLEKGLALRVPSDLLVEQPDGSLYLPMSRKQFGAALDAQAAGRQESVLVIPVIAEEVEVSKREVTTGRVQISKQVHEREEQIDVPILRQEVHVERVAIGEIVKTPPQIRYEGNTIVIPVLEEVLVVEKRLHLKEEVRVTRVQEEARDPQHVTLREEHVEVRRVDGEQQE